MPSPTASNVPRHTRMSPTAGSRSGGEARRRSSVAGAVEDGLDVVAVGIDDERAVIIGMIMRAWAGRAIVLAASFQAGRMELLDRRAGAVVCGDTTPHTKPHPAPLHEAMRQIGVRPEQCVYVGDDERDMVAGRAAGMATVAARYGYLGAGAVVERWPADAVINSPSELLNILETA